MSALEEKIDKLIEVTALNSQRISSLKIQVDTFCDVLTSLLLPSGVHASVDNSSDGLTEEGRLARKEESDRAWSELQNKHLAADKQKHPEWFKSD